MTNLRPPFTVAIGLVIAACSAKPTEIWVAARETEVYASNSDTETRTLFTLAAGDTCTPLRDVIMKVYQHTEIECGNGRGWVIDKQNFNIKTTG
jgi:hypothetical protein